MQKQIVTAGCLLIAVGLLLVPIRNFLPIDLTLGVSVDYYKVVPTSGTNVVSVGLFCAGFVLMALGLIFGHIRQR